ncbi:hypothetical protein KC963_04720, partial [Candidatus Saccharibacteria bacterium]|nr:hypothetical protein [Candidatus Saccharibacteria bacterium]
KVQAASIQYGQAGDTQLKKLGWSKTYDLLNNSYSRGELHIYVDKLVLPNKKLEYSGTLALHGEVHNHGNLKAKKLIIKHDKLDLFNAGVLCGDDIAIDMYYVDNSHGQIR